MQKDVFGYTTMIADQIKQNEIRFGDIISSFFLNTNIHIFLYI